MPETLLPIVAEGVPDGLCFDNWSSAIPIMAQYLFARFEGNEVNTGSSTPAAEDRAKPWYRTNSDGTDDGWWTFYNGFWIQKHPMAVGSVIMYEGAAADIPTFDGGESAAVTNITGPFWEAVTEMAARSPMHPGTLASGTIVNIGDNIGEEKHVMTTAEMVEHFHIIKTFSSGDTSSDGGHILNEPDPSTDVDHETEPAGSSPPDGMNVIHPVRGYLVPPQIWKNLPKAQRMRTTFGAIKPSLAKVLNLGQSDTRVLDVCNEAQERLLYSGKWVDSVIRYNVCVNEACLTWPRDIETIEAASVCCGPLFIRNGWYEFLQGGPGQATEDSCCLAGQLVDRENRVAFDDVVGTGKKIAVYCDANESAGAKILLRYYDSNGQKVYSTVSGAREEGEYITLPAGGAYTYSTYEVMPYGLYAVIKPATNRVIRLYEYTVAGGALKPLAYYEPDETVPVYRASLVPAMNRGGCGADSDEECARETLTIRGKIRFIPAYNDNSILSIPYGSAIRLGCQAIKKEEDNLILEAEAYWQKAYNILNQQLHHYQGDGVVSPIQVENMQPSMANLI